VSARLDMMCRCQQLQLQRILDKQADRELRHQKLHAAVERMLSPAKSREDMLSAFQAKKRKLSL
jgi:hypothetical protein